MRLYWGLDVDEETPVSFVGIHPLAWDDVQNGTKTEPTMLFRNVETEELQALVARLLVSGDKEADNIVAEFFDEKIKRKSE